MNFFLCDSNNWAFFLNWLTSLNFLDTAHRIELFLNTPLRIEKNWTLFFLLYDSKNWTLFFLLYDSMNLILFKYDSYSSFFMWFKELNIFRKCNSKNLLNFWKLLNFALKKDSKNWSFIFWKWVNELDPFFWIVTQRIPFVKYDSNGSFF